MEIEEEENHPLQQFSTERKRHMEETEKEEVLCCQSRIQSHLEWPCTEEESRVEKKEEEGTLLKKMALLCF